MGVNYQNLVDIFFPPSEDELLLRSCTFLSLNVQRDRNTALVSLSSFSDPTVRAAVHTAKFHHNHKALRMLAALVQQYCELLPTSQSYTIVPIPLSRARYRKRGYNQVTEVLKLVSLPKHITTDTNLLIRNKNTVPQTTLTKAERLQNMNNVFTVRLPHQVNSKRIIILDDVTTTGATLEAARAELYAHSPTSITGLALAH